MINIVSNKTIAVLIIADLYVLLRDLRLVVSVERWNSKLNLLNLKPGTPSQITGNSSLFQQLLRANKKEDTDVSHYCPCVHKRWMIQWQPPANQKPCLENPNMDFNVDFSLNPGAWTTWDILSLGCRDQFVNAPSQWETTLQCNVVSYWLGAYTQWSLQLWYAIALRRTHHKPEAIACLLVNTLESDDNDTASSQIDKFSWHPILRYQPLTS